MEAEQEEPKEGKKPSLLWPLLLWPLLGVPVFWLAHLVFFWFITRGQHPHDMRPFLASSFCALAVATAFCFIRGAFIGYHFAHRTTNIRFPLAEPIGCGFGAAFLFLAYNFGGCAAVGLISSAVSR